VLKGHALAELGKLDEAIRLLENVDQRTKGNPEYDMARALLAQVRERRQSAPAQTK
jgi:hypothetical protein